MTFSRTPALAAAAATGSTAAISPQPLGLRPATGSASSSAPGTPRSSAESDTGRQSHPLSFARLAPFGGVFLLLALGVAALLDKGATDPLELVRRGSAGRGWLPVDPAQIERTAFPALGGNGNKKRRSAYKIPFNRLRAACAHNSNGAKLDDINLCWPSPPPARLPLQFDSQTAWPACFGDPATAESSVAAREALLEAAEEEHFAGGAALGAHALRTTARALEVRSCIGRGRREALSIEHALRCDIIPAAARRERKRNAKIDSSDPAVVREAHLMSLQDAAAADLRQHGMGLDLAHTLVAQVGVPLRGACGRESGQVTEGDDGAVVENEACSVACRKSGRKASSVCALTGADMLKFAVSNQGPISALAWVTDDLLTYRLGEFSPQPGAKYLMTSEGRPVLLPVLVLGWGKNDDGGEYWIVNLMLGRDFGEDGIVFASRTPELAAVAGRPPPGMGVVLEDLAFAVYPQDLDFRARRDAATGRGMNAGDKKITAGAAAAEEFVLR